MTTTYVQKGDVIDVTAATGLTSGNIHLGTDRAGILVNDAVSGAVVGVAFSGVFSVTKAAAAGEAMTFMDKVYAKATGGANVASATGTVPLGHAAAAAATGATTVNVLLGSH